MGVDLDNPLLFQILNGLFEVQTYVKGAQASNDDKKVFQALSEAPNPTTYPHLARWYSHIAATQGLTKKDSEDDDIDLFGSDDEAEAAPEKPKFVAAAKKEAPVEKTFVTMEVKSWGTEIDIEIMESLVRSVERKGLTWGQSKVVEIAYGVKMLQINCVVTEECSIYDVADKLTAEHDPNKEKNIFLQYIQSVDIPVMTRV